MSPNSLLSTQQRGRASHMSGAANSRGCACRTPFMESSVVPAVGVHQPSTRFLNGVDLSPGLMALSTLPRLVGPNT